MNDEIAKKIKKLLSLSEGSSFPEEAATALAKAQELMTRFKVDQATLNNVDETDEPIRDFYESPVNQEDAGKRKLATWKWSLVSTLNRYNGVYAFCSGAKIILVGKTTDVNTVRYLYDYCRREIDRLTTANCKGQGRTYANNFRLGCVDAVKEALKIEQEKLRSEFEKANNERGLVVLDKVLVTAKHAKMFATKKFRLKNGSGSSWAGSASARSAGRAAGSSIYKGGAAGALPGAQRKLS